MMRNSAFRSRWKLVTISALLAGFGCAQANSSSRDPLLFPKDKFTLKTASVKMPDGEETIVYRLYEHLLYAAKPADKNYESLDVKVPVSINGVSIDATGAPILFNVNVGGYMSSPDIRTAGMKMPGPPPGIGGPPGGPVGPGGPGPGGLDGPGAGGPGGFAGGGPGSTDPEGLASGFVIVSPGARGRDNQRPDGTYYGKAPAAIVDLKAAVRYIRHNKVITYLTQ